MAQSLPANHIEAHIGDVSGGSQVAVGSYIVQIGRVEGGVVNILNAPPTPPRSRPQPVLLLPRAFPGMLDRETETSSAIQALQSKASVECSGEPGSGKTSLLRHLAYQPQVSSFTAGVIYFQVNQQSNDDLLKSFFDAFYEYDSPVKPTETEIRHYLQALNALILLDDVTITPEQIESLMNAAPNCTFITATSKRSLFGETREVTLKGLPTGEAVNLFQREFGRELSAEEQKGAQTLCESVDCIPQRVLRAAHQAREENRSLLDIVPQAKSASLDQTLAAAEVKPRSEDEKKVLAALAVFYGAPVAAEHVAAVAGVSDAAQMLDDFEKRGLVQSHEKRYALASDVNNALLGDLKPWLIRALAHFVDWTEAHRSEPALIAESAQPVLLILEWAVAAKHWPEVKRLGHATEEALTLSGKWDMWANALQGILKAAQGLQDRANEAWALHQLGTRALCLDARSTAQASLNGALALRESLNDQSGAAVTRHNLNILLHPPLPESDSSKPSGGNAGVGPTPLPLLFKLGLPILLGLGLIAGLLWWRLHPTPPVAPVNVVSFTVDPTSVPANGQAQLCYEVENAVSVRIEPEIGEKKPATKECLTVNPAATTTYTLTAFGSDGKTTSRQVTLSVDAAPPMAEIRRFDVMRENGPGGEGDVQFRLCYDVRNAAHAEIDNNGGPVALNQNRCQQIRPQGIVTYTLSVTGSDGRTITRQATADATKPPSPPPQILSFDALPPQIVAGAKAQLCFQLKDASSVQIDSGVSHLEAGTARQCISVAPIKTTTYTLTALNSEGKTDKKQATIKVSKPAPQIINFTSQPNSLREPGNIQLCYEVVNATSLQIDQGIGEVRPLNKSCVNAKVADTTTFTLTATGDGGTAKNQTTIRVEHRPLAVGFTANPPAITPPDSASLCYRVNEASSITIDHGVGQRRVPNPGESACVKVQPKETTTYTLTVVGSFNRTESRQVTVTVNERPQQPKHARIILFEANPTRIRAGESVSLCYGVANAVRAVILPIRRDIALVEKDCITDSPEKSRRYILRAVGEDKQVERRELSVEVIERVVPQVRITRFEIHATQLCYVVENARSARIDPQIGELNKLPADCPRISAVKPTTYTLTATGQDESKVQQSVSYQPPEPTAIKIISFTPATQTINSGARAKICYSTIGEGTAEISPQPGSVPPSLFKKCDFVSPKETTVYTMTVRGPQGQHESRSVTVKVERPGILVR